MTSQIGEFKVYFTNHGYFDERQFATVDEAVAFGRRAHFEFSVVKMLANEAVIRGHVVASWSPISGLHYY